MILLASRCSSDSLDVVAILCLGIAVLALIFVGFFIWLSIRKDQVSANQRQIIELQDRWIALLMEHQPNEQEE
jgi:uncharacterized protein YneF (UPF0154 family)